MGDKVYKVNKDFTDAKGQTWKKGQTFTGDEAEITQQVNNGNIVVQTS